MDPQTAQAPEAARWRAFRIVLRLGLGVGLCVALGVWLEPTRDELAAMTRFDWRFAVLSVAGTALAVVTTAARWQLLHETFTKERLPFRVYAHTITLTRLAGQLSSVLVADLLGRGLALRSAGSRQGLARLAAPVVLERLIDLLLPLAFLGWMFAVRMLGVAPWPSAIAISLFMLLALGPLLRPLCNFAVRAHAWLPWRRAMMSPPVSLPTRRSYAIVSLGLVRFGAVLLQFFGAGAAVGVLLSPQSLLGATSVAQLGALIGITPGGLGFVEAGWAAGLRWFGYDDAHIAIFAIAARVCLVVNFGILTLITWAWIRIATRRQ